MNNLNNQVYVFVVCGSQEHINTLHFALQALRKVSNKQIIVVTDATRNETPIIHPNIIDYKTPENYTHHQASIFLKTGLPKFLPSGNTYCYLDTDIVAVGQNVDTIFDQFVSPVTFAPDHCVTNQFSPSAIHCQCAAEFTAWETELKHLFKMHKDLIREPENEEKKAKLLHYLEEAKKDKFGYWLLSLRFNLARKIFKLDEDTFLNKQKHLWHDKNNAPILYEKNVDSSVVFIETIESTSAYRCETDQQGIWTIQGKNVFDCRCNHLKEAIQNTFAIDIQEEQWQHWNGGVFLFDDSSRDFLNAWHEKTIKIFSLPEWKTRDQGTLIATAWEFQLQSHPTLSRKYNLIADYLHLNIEHRGNLSFHFKKEQLDIKPEFIHIYHHWADKRWEVWQAVEQATGITIDPDTQTINALWIGKRISKLEMLTIQSFLAFGYRFKLWLYEPLENTLPKNLLIGDANEIIPKEQVFAYKNKNKYGHGKGSYAGFSDIFRYKLLHEKGGWWVDMDVTCLKPLDFDKPYFFRNHHELNVVGNVMKCPKHSPLMKRCYDEAIETVTEENTDWHKPIAILNNNIAALNLEQYIYKNVSNEDKWDITSKFIWSNETLPEHWHFIHWQNEEWRAKKVNRNSFYFQSALAKLLRVHQLVEIPQSRMAEIINTFKHSSFSRKLSIFK